MRYRQFGTVGTLVFISVYVGLKQYSRASSVNVLVLLCQNEADCLFPSFLTYRPLHPARQSQNTVFKEVICAKSLFESIYT